MKYIYKSLIFITLIAQASHSNANYLTAIFKTIFVDGITIKNEKQEGRTGGQVFDTKDPFMQKIEKAKNQRSRCFNISEYRLPCYKKNYEIIGFHTDFGNADFFITSNHISHRFIPGDLILAGLLCAGGFVAYKKWFQDN
jgi:hypothetical protein